MRARTSGLICTGSSRSFSERCARGLLESIVRQGDQRMPRSENRIALCSWFGEEIPPSPNRRGNDVRGGEDLVEAFFRVFLRLELSREVISDACPQAGGRLIRRSRMVSLNLCARSSYPFCTASNFSSPTGSGSDADQPFRTRLEDAIERVVIASRDRVELVIVAARALHGQRHRSPGDHIDAVIDNLVRDPDETAAACDEAHRGQVRRTVGNELIRGDLEEQETIVGKIVVERADDPIAISMSVNEEPLFAPIDITFRIGVTRDIEPMPAPALAIAGRGEQAIDYLANASGESSASKARTSSAVGGSPVRSKVARRIERAFIGGTARVAVLRFSSFSAMNASTSSCPSPTASMAVRH